MRGSLWPSRTHNLGAGSGRTRLPRDWAAASASCCAGRLGWIGTGRMEAGTSTKYTVILCLEPVMRESAGCHPIATARVEPLQHQPCLTLTEGTHAPWFRNPIQYPILAGWPLKNRCEMRAVTHVPY